MVRSQTRVLIAGGGVAALETLLALRALAASRVNVTLLTPERDFLYRPVTVAEAFGRGEARAYRLNDIAADQGQSEVIAGSLASVDARAKVVVTRSGQRLPYDVLVIATGAMPREPFPGALTFRGRSDVAAVRDVLEDLVAGRARSAGLVLPAERMWPLPIYELALMTAAHLSQHRADPAKVWLITPEQEPLELFGPDASAAVRGLLEARGIRLRAASLPTSFGAGMLRLAGGGSVPLERVITLPLLEGPSLMGVPHDARGFIPVDAHGRVRGVLDVYAAGDVTSLPLKQGGLAAQQADAVAEAIAARAGAAVTPSPFKPVLRGLLLTGGPPLYLRSEPQRLPREATVAIDARPARSERHEASSAADQALWWPPAKIAGRYLAPYLATTHPQPLGAEPFVDRDAVAGPAVSDDEFRDALELALLLAECDARWGDYGSALNALDAAEALQGALPPEYEAKRRRWNREQRFEARA